MRHLNRFGMLGLFALLVLAFSGHAEARQNCGIPGYIWHPCSADFVPKRQTLPGGIQQLVYQYADGTVAIYRAIPHSYMAQHALPLKTLIDQARDTFMRDWKATPSEAWLKTPEGADNFAMFFPGNRFVSIVPVKAGFLVGAFRIPSQTSPLFLHLKQEKLVTRKFPPQIKHIHPKYPMKKRRPAAQPNTAQIPKGGASWRCHSMGRYQSCKKSYGSYWERGCLQRTSTAFGFGNSRMAASVQANGICSRHMTNMIIISNMGGVGSAISQCRTISCQKLK
ncbi:MAG: hypothetical protein H6727_14795 [Myxococcales bacterium]|nr:hypothetical protein [Myxococcales bacterium]